MHELLESRVRRLVADHLGVNARDIMSEVSLVDGLAVDSLDMVEIVLALEDDLGIGISERAIDRIRTYGDLVKTVLMVTQRQREAEGVPEGAPVFVRARLVFRNAAGGGSFLCADWLTPYVAELITDSALQAGRGARLELTIPSDTGHAELAWVEHQFASLWNRGVHVSVRRDECRVRKEKMLQSSSNQFNNWRRTRRISLGYDLGGRRV